MGNDLDLLGSHDVIGQVTIRFAICHFLLVILWNEQTSLSVFEYSAPIRDTCWNYACAILRDIVDPCAKFKYILHRFTGLRWSGVFHDF